MVAWIPQLDRVLNPGDYGRKRRQSKTCCIEDTHPVIAAVRPEPDMGFKRKASNLIGLGPWKQGTVQKYKAL